MQQYIYFCNSRIVNIRSIQRQIFIVWFFFFFFLLFCFWKSLLLSFRIHVETGENTRLEAEYYVFWGSKSILNFLVFQLYLCSLQVTDIQYEKCELIDNWKLSILSVSALQAQVAQITLNISSIKYLLRRPDAWPILKLKRPNLRYFHRGVVK